MAPDCPNCGEPVKWIVAKRKLEAFGEEDRFTRGRDRCLLTDDDGEKHYVMHG